MDQGKDRLVPAVERATRILDYVSRTRHAPTVSELAGELRLAKSTTHTLCQTLCALDLLIRRSDQGYRLGPRLIRWSNAFTRQSDVATEFATIWDEESEVPGATISLTVLEGDEVIYIAARNSARSHALVEFRTGMRLPAAFTATGKAFLGSMSEFEVKRLYAQGLPEPRTAHSVRTLEALLAELAEVRRNGYSVDDQQVADGLICFGAPVIGPNNTPIAGVAVSVLIDDATETERARLVANLKRIAERLSQRMGADLG